MNAETARQAQTGGGRVNNVGCQGRMTERDSKMGTGEPT